MSRFGFNSLLKHYKIICAGISSSMVFNTINVCANQEQYIAAPVIQLESTTKAPKLLTANLIQWGQYCGRKKREMNDMNNIDIKKMCLGENIDCILDNNGNIYFKFNDDLWLKWNGITNIKDICLTNDFLYIINNNNKLLEFEYLKSLNKYKNPCIEDNLLYNKYEDCSTKDGYRKKSLSVMPVNEYYKFIKPEFKWNNTESFINTLNILKDETFYNEVNTTIKEPIIKVFANDYRIFAITTNGDVYVKGDNQRGACGMGYEIPNNPNYLFIEKFTKIPTKFFDSKVTEIALGEDHTLFLTETGRLFTCGADNMLQLGLGWTKRKCIQSDSNWTELGKEGYISMANAFDETDPDKCEFFFEVPPYDEFYPRVLTGPYFDNYRVISIDCGDYHSAAIIEPLFHNNPLSRKRKKVSNNNNNNELKSDMMSTDVVINKINGLTKRIAEIEFQRGGEQDLEDMRRVLTWGCSLKGQLGHANYSNASIPKPLKMIEKYREYVKEINDMVRLRPTNVRCGKDHTIILMNGHSNTSSCMVFGFGSNQYNQISASKKKKKYHQPYWIQKIIPKPPMKIKHIQAGAFKSAAYQ